MLRVFDGFNLVGILQDDEITFTPPPANCLYELIDNYKLSAIDPDMQFLKVTSAYGYLIYRVVNPYGYDLSQAEDGRICDKPLVAFKLNADKTLITDVKIDDGGLRVARKLQFIFDSNPASPEPKFYGHEKSVVTEETERYVQCWHNTQAMLYYIAEYNRILSLQMVYIPRTFNHFMAFIGEEVRRGKYIQESRSMHSEPDSKTNKKEKNHIANHAENVLTKLRLAQNDKSTSALLESRSVATTSSDTGVIRFSKQATAAPINTVELDQQFEIELGKTMIQSLADKYKIIGSKIKVAQILDEIVNIYRSHPSLHKASLSNIFRQLFESCPILELMLCMQALVYLHEKTDVDVLPVNNQLKATIIEITLKYPLEAFRDEVLQFFCDNHVDDILFKFCPARLLNVSTNLCDAIADNLSKSAQAKDNKEESHEVAPAIHEAASLDQVRQDKTFASSNVNKRAKRQARNAAAKPASVDDDSFSVVGCNLVAPTPYAVAADLLKTKLFSKIVKAEFFDLLNNNPRIASETHHGQPTLLMLAVANPNVPRTVIEALINHANANCDQEAIAHLALDHSGVMHWWCKYRDPNLDESFKIFKLLFKDWITYLQTIKFAKFLASHSQLNYAPLIEYFRDASGNTFLHLLIPKVKNQSRLEEYLECIIPPMSCDVSLQATSALLIAKNALGQNAICILKEPQYVALCAGGAVPERKTIYQKAEIPLKLFYNRLAARLCDDKVVIDPSAYGVDALNVFNFQPNDPKDLLVRIFKKGGATGITLVYRIVQDQMELSGSMRGGNLWSGGFVNLSEFNEISSMFLTDTEIFSRLCIDLYRREISASKPALNSTFKAWLDSKEIHTTPIECLTRYLIVFAIQQSCPDQDEIATCLAVISLLVAQLRAMPVSKWPRAAEKKHWDFAASCMYSALSFLGDLPELRPELSNALRQSLKDFHFFVQCYTLARNENGIKHHLKNVFKLLNAKDRISEFDQKLILTLKSGLTSCIVEGEDPKQSIKLFLRECSCHGVGPLDVINDLVMQNEVRMNFDPSAIDLVCNRITLSTCDLTNSNTTVSHKKVDSQSLTAGYLPSFCRLTTASLMSLAVMGASLYLASANNSSNNAPVLRP
jgi:hypothetical protein